MNNQAIKFYSVNDKYGEFSNFALFPIKLKGKTWPTSEHYFQAQKFVGMEHEYKIQKAKSPMKAAKLGRMRSVPIRKNWNKIKDNIMYDALKAKFTQYPELKELLLQTGDQKIIEHTVNDSYWGDGGDGSGKNMLGILLVKLREELRN